MDTVIGLILLGACPAIMLGIYIGLRWADHDDKDNA